MKILVLNYEYPPIGGGGGIISRYISEGLAGLGNEVVVVTTYFERREEKGERREEKGCIDPIPLSRRDSTLVQGNLRVIRLRSRRRRSYQSNPREMLSWIAVTKKFLRSWDETASFDICMAHFALPGGEVGLWLKRQFNIPYVVISHGHDIPWVHPRQMLMLHMLSWFRLRQICKRSSLNFVQTRMMKANIDRFLGRKYADKNVIIPNGVSPALFCPDPSKRPGRLRILFTGRLVIQKDPMTFLRALKIFTKNTRDFGVHVIGDGSLRKKMERFVRRNGLEENVRFFGKVPADRMAVEFQAAHLMVAPSLNEGMSISALEALCCGAYLIATRASGYPDMILENVNGEFIPFRDPAELAERMIRFHETLFRDDHRTEPLRALSGFNSWEEICQRYHDALSLLVG